MQLARYDLGLRRGAAFAALGTLLVATALTLSQCKMVNEQLTGVGLSASQPDRCITACVAAYNDSIRAESALHVTNVHACDSDSLCLALEEMRHEAAVNRIQMGRQNCLNNCHHQGRGGGGR